MPVSALNGEAPSVRRPFRILKRCVFTEKSVSSELLVGQTLEVSCKRVAKNFETEIQVFRSRPVAREGSYVKTAPNVSGSWR